jgi:hypothetical protein
MISLRCDAPIKLFLNAVHVEGCGELPHAPSAALSDMNREASGEKIPELCRGLLNRSRVYLKGHFPYSIYRIVLGRGLLAGVQRACQVERPPLFDATVLVAATTLSLLQL